MKLPLTLILALLLSIFAHFTHAQLAKPIRWRLWNGFYSGRCYPQAHYAYRKYYDTFLLIGVSEQDLYWACMDDVKENLFFIKKK